MADAAVKEPSMEDILSSIRQIIAEEGHTSEAAEKLSQEPSPAKQSEEVHRKLSEQVLNQDTPPASHSSQATQTPQTSQLSQSKRLDPTDVLKAAVEPQKADESQKAVEPPKPDVPSKPDVRVLAAQMRDEAQAETSQSAPEERVDVEKVEVERLEVERVEMEHATKAPEAPLVAPTSISDAYGGENRRSELPISEQISEPAPIEQAPASVAEVSTFKGALMSPSADNAVSSAFDRLKRSTQDDLDATTEALLRPMLREWLDENLPTMVERLIREEIERVARGV